MNHSPLYRTRILLSLGGIFLALPATLQAQDYPHADELIGTIEDVYDGHLTPDLAVSTFRNIDRLFPTRTIPASDTPRELPEAPVDLPGMVTYQVDDATYDLYDFLSLNNVTGMIVLKDGAVVFETYQRGNTADTRWMSMSVAKSITSALVGAAMAVMAALPRAHAPGTHHTYSTGETQVLGEVVHGAVGMPLSDYLAEKIWQPYGMEADANWWLDSPDGVEIGGSGLSATLRDFARFGQFFLEGGVIDGSAILPDEWTETAGLPQKLTSGETVDYGYMWWPGWTEPSIADGAFAAIGIQGQNIYINPARNVVIATHMAQPKPLGREPVDPLVVFDAIAAALD